MNDEVPGPIVTVTAVTVHRPGARLFDEAVFTLRLEDEAAGPFIRIKSNMLDQSGHDEMSIDFDEWPALTEAVIMLKQSAAKLEGRNDE